MGTTFSNLHIKKNEKFDLKELKKFFTELMTKKGYTAVNDKEQGEIAAVIYAPKESGWASVACEDFTFGDDKTMREAAMPFSEAFSADVIAASCCDSDFMFLNLINSEKNKDGWINVGRPYGSVPRRTSFKPWEEAAGDLEALKAIMKGEEVFAEGAWFTAGQRLFGMTGEQCGLMAEHIEPLKEDALTILYFALPDNGSENEPSMLVIPSFNLMPCKIGESSCIFAVNKGGASTGIAVEFFGDLTENDEITFEDVTFVSDIERDWKGIPITLKKVKGTKGEVFWYWEDKSFKIPPKVNPNLPFSKQMDIEFKREFGVRFTPKGNPRKVLDIKVAIVPLKYFDGKNAALWYVWKGYESKKAFIEWNHEDCKRSLIPMDESELKKNEFYLNEEDFDL